MENEKPATPRQKFQHSFYYCATTNKNHNHKKKFSSSISAMFHSKSDDDEVVVATAVAVAAEPVKVPKPSNELLAVMTPFCQAHAEQHGQEFRAVVNDLVQWAIAEAPKFNMPWEEYIMVYVGQREAEEEASRNQNNLKATMIPPAAATASTAAMTFVTMQGKPNNDDSNNRTANTAEEEQSRRPTPLKNDQETTTIKVETLELLIGQLERSIESNRNVEISTLKCSLEEAREQFKKETSSLRKEITDQKKELDELRTWDTVNITWQISTFDRAIYSNTFNVAQYTMRMRMCVVGDRRYGYLGFYICHTKGHGYDWFPIQLGGSSISVIGNQKEDTETNHYPANTVIEEDGRGNGWNEFVAMKDLEKKFVKDGKLTLKAKVRVRRSTIANLNLKPA